MKAGLDFVFVSTQCIQRCKRNSAWDATLADQGIVGCSDGDRPSNGMPRRHNQGSEARRQLTIIRTQPLRKCSRLLLDLPPLAPSPALCAPPSVLLGLCSSSGPDTPWSRSRSCSQWAPRGTSMSRQPSLVRPLPIRQDRVSLSIPLPPRCGWRLRIM